MAGDATQTNPPTNDGAAPLPIVATNATETDGVDRSVHPSGIVPTLPVSYTHLTLPTKRIV